MTKKSRILAGVVGGMAGGTMMALGLYATSKIDLSHLPVLRRVSDREDQITFIGTSYRGQEDVSMLGKSVLASAILGGIYGGLRSAFRLPSFLLGPAFGLTSLGMDRIGMGRMMNRTPGPWNNRARAVLPRLLTHGVYGLVADAVSERVEKAMD